MEKTLSCLEETENSISNYERLNNSLDSKIIERKEKRIQEIASQHLLRYELSALRIAIDRNKKVVSALEKDYQRLTTLHIEVIGTLKTMRNLNAVNRLRMDQKERNYNKLLDECHTLDFEVEQLADCSQVNSNTLTKYD